MTTGHPAFDLNNQRQLRSITAPVEGIGNLQDLGNLAGIAWLKGHPGNMGGVELLHQAQRLLQRRDTRRTDHTVDGGAIFAGHQYPALAGDLHPPLRRRKVHRIKLCFDAWFQQLAEPLDILVQNLCCGLTAPG